MKRLLLMTTGGTIASIQGEEGLAPGLDAEGLMSYIPRESQDYSIESKHLMSIDSTNMQPEWWVEIAEAVYAEYDHYDGFIITHGTDTMAYTAAALSYMLQNVSKPIIITGSQIPINQDKTDGKRNVLDAISMACETISGIYIVFNGRVIQGTRAVKLRTKSYDAFESVNYPDVANIDESGIHYFRTNLPENLQELKLDCALCPDVFLLKLCPGTKPELFDHLKQLYKGLIIESFGYGGIPFMGRDLLPKMRELIASGMAVVITTQCLEEGENLNLYEVGKKTAREPIILSGDMNTEAIVPKLMWALGKTKDLREVKTYMETPICHDITPFQR